MRMVNLLSEKKEILKSYLHECLAKKYCQKHYTDLKTININV